MLQKGLDCNTKELLLTAVCVENSKKNSMKREEIKRELCTPTSQEGVWSLNFSLSLLLHIPRGLIFCTMAKKTKNDLLAVSFSY